METTKMGYIRVIICRDTGKENRNYYNGFP